MKLNNFEGKIQQLIPQRPFDNEMSIDYIQACKTGKNVSVE